MNAKGVKAMLAKNIKKYGVEIRYRKASAERNSRGVTVNIPGGEVVKERVMLLKERYSPVSSAGAPIGASLDTARYIMAMPESPLARDFIVTDSHGNTWRLDTPDWFDVNGEPVCKQCRVDLVMGLQVPECGETDGERTEEGEAEDTEEDKEEDGAEGEPDEEEGGV